jgi:hypothetical protein
MLCSVFVILVATLLLSAGKASAQSTFTCGKWNRAAISVRGTFSTIYAVAGSSANDVWAVGERTPVKNQTYTVGYIQHWNGTSWSNVKIPSTPGNSYLYAVTSISSNDAWAVGFGDSGELTFHWNGTKWKNILDPNQGGTLLSVSGISTNDVWAVGDNVATPLSEHWDGTQWSVIPTPVVGTSSYVDSVSADASNDVWAAGYYYGQNVIPYALVERWDGTQWSAINVPQPGVNGTYFNSVTAISPNDVWAVGYYLDVNYIETSLTEHWDGTEWTVVSSPNPGGHAEVNAVAAVSSTDVWAVGFGGGLGSFTMQWNGTQWNTMSDPYPKNYQGDLDAVTALPNNQGIWAVGSYYTLYPNMKLLTEYYC